MPRNKELPLVGDVRNISKRLVLSYAIDWVFIVGIALIGYGFHRVTPNHMPFSLTDQNISLPYKPKDTVSTAVLVVVSLIAPAVIIVALSLLVIPGSPVKKTASTSLLWRYKVWEWNAGWLGLALAVAGVFMATEGLKDLYGKPRPDFLARCNPDISQISTYAVGGLGQKLDGATTLVSGEICQNKSHVVMMDGFSSFPSGHSSFSFAGLTYFSLWLCSKFSIGFPYFAHSPFTQDRRSQQRDLLRSNGAAPPIYMVIIVFVPWAVAFFISASRWFDHRHHGFDIIFGSVMGMLFAWVGFHLYHLPIMRGAGWAWGARSRKHAFFKGVGLPSNVGADGWSNSSVMAEPSENETQGGDLESGRRNLTE